MNFIVICLDSLRRDHVGCYGNSWIRTPNLDKFGRENIIFDNMYPNGIPTLPFRRGVMQGRRVHPFRDRVPRHPRNYITLLGWHGLAEQYLTIQEVLQQNGYITGMITDVPHMFPPDVNFHIGFDSFEFIRGNECDRYRTGGTRRKDYANYIIDDIKGTIQQRYLEQQLIALDEARSEEDYFSARVFRAAEKWLERNARYYEKFYLYIDSFDPHEPWNPPYEYRRMYDKGYEGREIVLPQPESAKNMTESELKHMRAMYAGKVTMVDRWFGHFMEKFNHMELHEDTAVLVVSDHGHPLGEHGIVRKIPSACRFNMLDAVMLMSLPVGYGCHGKRIATMIHEYDFAPTLLSLAGVEKPDSMNGKDFSKVLTGEAETNRTYAAGGYGPFTYVRTTDYYYLLNLANQKEKYLFDLKADPKNMNNIADSKPQLVAEMDLMVEKELDGWTIPEQAGTSGYLREWKPAYRIRKKPWTSVYS
ncbi:MAG: sulfatase [Deltaproteobacteria bacterium]|nr:sulfatase [Deltaproteobacteria bacterium]MBW1993131.1 sulfatase [Deltaproteobacteria bacterium]MBW2153025.1 sulfatase [Deltaproteobacteria bacterium]